jgi:anionic cell wall polymer biosynthesis LytR-Cps2A-Psr (LCP) family protein
VRVDDNVVEPGQQRLLGVDALVYGRDRKTRSDGDFGRNRAQAELLAAMHAEAVEQDPSPVELARLLVDLRRFTVSSIPPARMAVLAALALDIDPADVERRQTPGVNANRGGAAVVMLTAEAEALIADLRDDGTFDR